MSYLWKTSIKGITTSYRTDWWYHVTQRDQPSLRDNQNDKLYICLHDAVFPYYFRVVSNLPHEKLRRFINYWQKHKGNPTDDIVNVTVHLWATSDTRTKRATRFSHTTIRNTQIIRTRKRLRGDFRREEKDRHDYTTPHYPSSPCRLTNVSAESPTHVW